MDWENVIADRTCLVPCHYTAGRSGSIQGITIHHMAGNLSIDDCYSVWTNREASAHYAVEADGTIGQLVNDCDTAWACGDWWANSNTISIEHANDGSDPWTVWPAAVDAGAHLVAALCRYYNLGEPEWMVNVFPHSHWQATGCPGELAGSQNAEYMAKAKAYYNGNGGASVGKWIQESTGEKRWWYKHADGGCTKNDWEKINGSWYLFDKDGWMLTGWQKRKGCWFYLQPEGVKGWAEGEMHYGWLKLDGSWYYFGGSEDGRMREGECERIDGKWYAFGANGKMLTEVKADENGALAL